MAWSSRATTNVGAHRSTVRSAGINIHRQPDGHSAVGCGGLAVGAYHRQPRVSPRSAGPYGTREYYDAGGIARRCGPPCGPSGLFPVRLVGSGGAGANAARPNGGGIGAFANITPYKLTVAPVHTA